MNSKKNSKSGDLAENVAIAITQKKNINQDIHNVKGMGQSIKNIGWINLLIMAR